MKTKSKARIKRMSGKGTTTIVKRVESAAWITSMHSHYQQTGVYGAADLNRVLGDPRKQISGDSTDELALACRPQSRK
mgnify:CR=1 FL=1